MTSVSLAPSLVVPMPAPAVALAHVAAVARPGLPGATTEPARTPLAGVVCDATAGVQPRSLPGKLWPPAAVNVPTWPETVQPGTVFRVVVTCAPGSVPWLDSVAPLTCGRVKLTVALVTVSLNVPVFGIVWTIVSVPFVVGVVLV